MINGKECIHIIIGENKIFLNSISRNHVDLIEEGYIIHYFNASESNIKNNIRSILSRYILVSTNQIKVYIDDIDFVMKRILGINVDIATFNLDKDNNNEVEYINCKEFEKGTNMNGI